MSDVCQHVWKSERFYTGRTVYDERVCVRCGVSNSVPVKNLPKNKPTTTHGE